MNLVFLFYVFLSIVIITGGGYYFFSIGNEITAAIYFLGATIAALFFGFRWFLPPGATEPGPGSWPPSINYCPDFLTLTTIDGEKVCIDMIGVAQGGTNTLNVNSDGTSSGDCCIFNLYLNAGSDRTSKLCEEAKAKGVTWEGVWTGTTCTGTAPPLPP
jgi:hypothetical protein